MTNNDKQKQGIAAAKKAIQCDADESQARKDEDDQLADYYYEQSVHYRKQSAKLLRESEK
jgi:hypothetical protein